MSQTRLAINVGLWRICDVREFAYSDFMA